MRRHFQSLSAMGAEMSWTGYQVSMADVYREAGHIEEGLTVVAEALARVARTGERFFEAELYRARGDLLVGFVEMAGQVPTASPPNAEGPHDDGAEASFLRAISIARERSAKSHELRATISLCRLMAKRGEYERARQMLADLLSWFREGFDTSDLKTASALLSELEKSTRQDDERIRVP